MSKLSDQIDKTSNILQLIRKFKGKRKERKKKKKRKKERKGGKKIQIFTLSLGTKEKNERINKQINK